MGQPQATISIHSVQLHRKDTLTVWLDVGKGNDRHNVQLEIRILSDGTIELYCEKSLTTTIWEAWERMQE